MAMIKLTTLKCKRCGHKWIPRQTKLPKTCPKCHSPYWNTARKKPKTKK
jgi:predicted Zn-ribbon and HTH transcriptional regulator